MDIQLLKETIVERQEEKALSPTKQYLTEGADAIDGVNIRKEWMAMTA